jgi:rhodanese-related sulfurtransferase
MVILPGRSAGISAYDYHRLAGIMSILILLLFPAAHPLCATSDDESKSPLFDLLISVEAIVADMDRKQETILIDIRPAEQFEKLRIPGSLNMPLFAIKTKPFLKRKTLIIVDEGYRYFPIAQEFKLLMKAGFRIRILNGGLYAWSQKGAPLQGDALVRRKLNRVSPMHFFTEKDHQDWIILDVSDGKRSASPALFTSSLSLPYRKGDTSFLSQYAKQLNDLTSRRSARILVVDEHGETYDFLERIIQTTAFKEVFFLEGGMDAYEKFLEGKKAGARKHPVTRTACSQSGSCR